MAKIIINIDLQDIKPSTPVGDFTADLRNTIINTVGKNPIIRNNQNDSLTTMDAYQVLRTMRTSNGR